MGFLDKESIVKKLQSLGVNKKGKFAGLISDETCIVVMPEFPKGRLPVALTSCSITLM